MASDRPSTAHHYQKYDQVPETIQKYWAHRYDIFSKYDEDVWLTDTAWYGVTPEPIATKIATHVAEVSSPQKTVLIDAFAGVGGNAIAFALSGRWSQIFAIEQDKETLACAQHNAKVYGVTTKIWFIQGNCFSVLKTRLASVRHKAVLFGSPPWGGPGYSEDAVFNVDAMEPYGLPMMHDFFASTVGDFVLYLPRNTDLRQLAQYARGRKKLAVTHYCMSGASKALCVFFGDLSAG